MKISTVNAFYQNQNNYSKHSNPSFGIHLGEHFKETIGFMSDRKSLSKKSKELIKKIDNNHNFDDWILDINNSGKYLTLFPTVALPYKKYLHASPVAEIHGELMENALEEFLEASSAEEKITLAKKDIASQLKYIEEHGKQHIDTKSFLDTLNAI
ncbi:MAG TPA: hypothetical protein PLG15_00645 [Candidatus Gastranaerophilaceae bacterium]|nr:hypothetical protein [Candidatus Gastranaerophilaceae bacterium]HPT40875.1 hypothetical protein [Candidatus Gastranaerophilaceae bacterium]